MALLQLGAEVALRKFRQQLHAKVRRVVEHLDFNAKGRLQHTRARFVDGVSHELEHALTQPQSRGAHAVDGTRAAALSGGLRALSIRTCPVEPAILGIWADAEELGMSSDVTDVLRMPSAERPSPNPSRASTSAAMVPPCVTSTYSRCKQLRQQSTQFRTNIQIDQWRRRF